MDCPYIHSVEAQIKPTKLIDNRLIDLKNHPDFIIPEPDLTNYVKIGEYGSGKLVRVKSAHGMAMTSDGYIYPARTSRKIIDARPTYCWLDCAMVDDILVSAIKNCNSYTTSEMTLTDTEKTSALKWLGVSYANLPDKPFGGSEPIDINYADKGDFEPLLIGSNSKAYFQTEKTYPVIELLGATVTYRDGSSQSDTTTLSSSHIVDNTSDGVTFRISSSIFIFVAYTSNYHYSVVARNPFPKAGVYFSWYDDGDPYEIQSLKKEGEGITYLENKYLNLADHDVIKALMSRIEALEG
jgi:hypothetical protein